MNALKSLLMPLVLPKIKVSATSLARKTVLILGFGGSKVRNYKRLERYYAAMDVNTITFVMPLLTPKFLRVMYMDEVLRNVKDVVLDSSGDDNGLLVHSFSNNGIWAYGEYCVQVQMSSCRLVCRLCDHANHHHDPLFPHTHKNRGERKR